MSSIDEDGNSGELLLNLHRLVSGEGEKPMDGLPDFQADEILIPDTSPPEGSTK